MLITEKILQEAPIKNNWWVLPNGARIHYNTGIADTIDIGDNAYIGKNISIWSNAHIGERVHIGDNAYIGNNVEIGNDTRINDKVRIGNNAKIGDHVRIRDKTKIGENAIIGKDTIIGDNTFIGDNVLVGNIVHIGNNAVIPYGVTIPDDTKIYIIWLTYSVHYAGERNGKHLFRLGCEIHPLSWFTSRKRGYSKIDDFGNYQYNSGWARVWDANEMSEDEYRRYLRFFKDEAKRLGI